MFKKLTIFFFISFTLFIVLIPNYSSAAIGVDKPSDGVKNYQLNVPIGDIKDIDVKNGNILGDYIKVWYGFLMGIAGILATVMMIFAGVKWMVSRGDSGAIGESKTMMISAVTGLALMFLSYSILALINPSLLTITMPELKVLPEYTGKYEIADASQFAGKNFASSAPVEPGVNVSDYYDEIHQAILDHKLSPDDEAYLRTIMALEGADPNFRNPSSTASGLMQITVGTAIQIDNQLRLGYGLEDMSSQEIQNWLVSHPTESIDLAAGYIEMARIGGRDSDLGILTWYLQGPGKPIGTLDRNYANNGPGYLAFFRQEMGLPLR